MAHFYYLIIMLIVVTIKSLIAQNISQQELQDFLRPRADLSAYEVQLASTVIADGEIKLNWRYKFPTRRYNRFEIVYSVDYFKTSKFKYNFDRSSVNYMVADIATQTLETFDQCVRTCALNPNCYHFVYNRKVCHLRGINYRRATRREPCPNNNVYLCGIIIDSFPNEIVNRIQYNEVVVFKIRLYSYDVGRWSTYSNEIYSFYQYYYDDDHMQCNNPGYCYGFGDPHYRTFDGHNLYISNSCTYILSSDSCENRDSRYTYIVLVNHERRYGYTQATYIKSVDIFYNNREYIIDTDFRVNVRGYLTPVNLPFYSNDYKLRVYRNKNFIVFDTEKFNVQFDGNQLLKFRNNNRNLCGICGYTKDAKQDDISQLNKLNQLYMRPDPEGKCLKA